jgi:hypothetical protein
MSRYRADLSICGILYFKLNGIDAIAVVYPSCSFNFTYTICSCCSICVFCMLCRSLFVLFLLAIVLSVLWYTASDYPFGIFWPLYCLSFFDLRLLITPLVSFSHCIVLSFDLGLLITTLVSFSHCIVCHLIYGFWLPRWYLLVIVLSVLWFRAADYPVGIFWPLYCISFFDLRLLVTSLVSFGHCIVCPLNYDFWIPLWYLLAIVLYFPLWFTASGYLFGIFWSLYCLSFILRFTASDYLFCIFWPLYCLPFFDLRILITSFGSFNLFVNLCNYLTFQSFDF